MNFSFDTIKEFDRHIEMSIPNYSELKEYLLKIASYFIKDNCTVIDIGCSTGLLIERLSNDFANAKYKGYDISDNLLGKAIEEKRKNVEFIHDDVTKCNLPDANLIFSVYLLQFLPIKERLPLLNKIYNALDPGGALIICEKTYQPQTKAHEILTFSYYDFKLKHFSAEEILKKQFDLRKIMNPLTEEENVKLFKESGFKTIFSFWQSLLFKGWVCIK